METMQGKQDDDAGSLGSLELELLSRKLEQIVLLLRNINTQLAYSCIYLREIHAEVTDEAWDEEPQEPEGRSELELAQSRQPADLDLDMDWGGSPF